MEDQAHSVLLSPGLTPIFEFQNIERKMLGYLYSECIPTYSANNYNDHRNFDGYYQKTSCVFKALIGEIVSTCHCYPNYIDAMSIISSQMNLNNVPGCGFVAHATCVATIMDHFRIDSNKCKPACVSHTFTPKSIQYVKTSEKRVDLMRNVLNLTKDIEITSMVVLKCRIKI